VSELACRCWNRFGSFQICKGPDPESGGEGPSAGRPDVVRQLADYVVRNFYPQVDTQTIYCLTSLLCSLVLLLCFV